MTPDCPLYYMPGPGLTVEEFRQSQHLVNLWTPFMSPVANGPDFALSHTVQIIIILSSAAKRCYCFKK